MRIQKSRTNLEVEKRTDTYGNDQTVLFITSSAFFPISMLDAHSLVGESKHGVTSSCKNNDFSL